jgi:hypothetical protein
LLQVAVVLAAMGLRHQHGYVISHHLFDRVAKHSLGRRVCRFDDSLFIDADQRIDNRLENGSLLDFTFLLISGGTFEGDGALPDAFFEFFVEFLDFLFSLTPFADVGVGA